MSGQPRLGCLITLSFTGIASRSSVLALTAGFESGGSDDTVPRLSREQGGIPVKNGEPPPEANLQKAGSIR